MIIKCRQQQYICIIIIMFQCGYIILLLSSTLSVFECGIFRISKSFHTIFPIFFFDSLFHALLPP